MFRPSGPGHMLALTAEMYFITSANTDCSSLFQIDVRIRRRGTSFFLSAVPCARHLVFSDHVAISWRRFFATNWHPRNTKSLLDQGVLLSLLLAFLCLSLPLTSNLNPRDPDDDLRKEDESY